MDAHLILLWLNIASVAAIMVMAFVIVADLPPRKRLIATAILLVGFLTRVSAILIVMFFLRSNHLDL